MGVDAGVGRLDESARRLALRALQCQPALWPTGKRHRAVRRGAAWGSTARSLRALVREPIARRLAIAEINLAGNLHRHLARCPGLRHSEYGSRDPQVPSEDLTRLSYADASFDLVITADKLEHVPDIDLALRETYRVLRLGGAHVFSVPVIWDRQTR